MGFLEKLDRLYYVETSKPKAEILFALQEKISIAKKENIFFSLDSFGYKNFVLWGDRLIIRYTKTFFSPYRGVGYIRISIKEEGSLSVISAKITPLGVMKEIEFWINVAGSLLFGAFAIWLIPMSNTLAILPLMLAIIWTIFFVRIRYSRYSLLTHLKMILEDLNIKDDLLPK